MSDNQPELFVQPDDADPVKHDQTPASVPQDFDESRPVLSHLIEMERLIRSVVQDLFETFDSGRSDGWTDTIARSGVRLLEQRSTDSSSSNVVLGKQNSESHGLEHQAFFDLRDAVQQNVVRPLYKLIKSTASGESLQTAINLGFDRMDTAARNLPEIVDRKEPGALYDIRENDSALVKVRKTCIQLGRAITPGSADKTHVQRVSLRRDTLHHLRVDVVPSVKKSLELTLVRYAQTLPEMERCLTNWTHAVLDAERLFDQVKNHYPEGEHISVPELKEDDPVAPDPETEVLTEIESAASGEDLSNGKKTSSRQDVLDELQRAIEDLIASLQPMDRDTQAFTTQRSLDIDNAIDRFKTGVQSSGTFMSVVKDYTDAPIREKARLSPRLEPWIGEIISRFEFCLALLDAKKRLSELQNSLIQSLSEATVSPLSKACESASVQLRDLHQEAVDVFEQVGRFGTETDLPGRLENWKERAVRMIHDGIISHVGSLNMRDRIEEIVEDHQTRSREIPNIYPEVFVVHDVPDSAITKIEFRSEPYALEFREYVQSAIDVALDKRMSISPEKLLSSIKEILKNVANITDVIRFNLGEAQTEIREQQNSLESVRELALNGLARSAESLMLEADRLSVPMTEVTEDVDTLFAECWNKIHERARIENQALKYIIDAKSSLEEQQKRLMDTLAARGSEFLKSSKSAFRQFRIRVAELVRLGRAAVGEIEHHELSFQETIEALSKLEEILATVPQVYRRLFSFNPVLEPDLLVGRDKDRLAISKHVKKWKQGLTQSLLISGSPSSGRTSLLNVLKDTVFRDAEVVTLSLKQRILDEAHLTDQLIRTLNLDLSDRSRPLLLEDLNIALNETDKTDILKVVIIEHIEHLFLRTIGGTKLLARLLIVMSRTDSKILWLSTVSEFGWQYFASNERAAASLVTCHILTELDRPAIEKLIMSRHRKSGYTLQFEMGDVSNPLLKRRLKKAPSAEAEQKILRDVYFDRLHSVCGQNIMLALYSWIRSITVNEDESGVTVRALNPIKFAFLGAFSLQQATALKSLLDHRSLTIEEYSEVSQANAEESLAIFESFANALLIEMLDEGATPDHFNFLSVEPGVRYRIRPLTVQPVVQFLRGRNIVY